MQTFIAITINLQTPTTRQTTKGDRVTGRTHHTGAQCIKLKKEKTSVFCVSLPNEHAYNVQ